MKNKEAGAGKRSAVRRWSGYSVKTNDQSPYELSSNPRNPVLLPSIVVDASTYSSAAEADF
jgi:hypothetical protein